MPDLPVVSGRDARQAFERLGWTSVSRVSIPASGPSIEDQIALWFGFWGGLAAGQELHAELDREPADAVAVDCMLGGALVAVAQLETLLGSG